MKNNLTENPCGDGARAPKHFCRDLVAAIGQLQTRLQEKYAERFAERDDLLTRALAEAEELAWETPFPHLFLPDFAEVRVAELAEARDMARAA